MWRSTWWPAAACIGHPPPSGSSGCFSPAPRGAPLPSHAASGRPTLAPPRGRTRVLFSSISHRTRDLWLDLTEQAITVPRLAPALDGLSIVHLSDFHFTGHVGKHYFQEVVRHSNELQPDLVAVTGDLVDVAACIDWIPDTLGGLSARHGVYLSLGIMTRRWTFAGFWTYSTARAWCTWEAAGSRSWCVASVLFWPAMRCPGWGPRRTWKTARRATAARCDPLSPHARSACLGPAGDADVLLAGHARGGQIACRFWARSFRRATPAWPMPRASSTPRRRSSTSAAGYRAGCPYALNCPPESPISACTPAVSFTAQE